MRKTSALGLGLLLVVAGCVQILGDEAYDNGSQSCTAGDVVDSSPSDCKASVCVNGAFSDQPDNTEIPDDMNPCTVDSCLDGANKNDPKADGEICMLGATVGVCAAGLCVVSCSGASDCDDMNPCTTDSCGADMKCAFVADDAAVPEDQNPCTNDSCSGGIAKHDNAPAGTSCGPNGTCDGMGACSLGCTMDTQCPADTECADNFCDTVSGTCKTTLKNAQTKCASGVCDGKGACVECVGTNNCMLDFTCAMNKCFDCNDGMKNGTETDLDCGGECIARCVRGQMCNATPDCDGECENGVCVDCFDATKNGTEGDVDCGGTCAQKCGTNQGCNVALDCFSGVCTGNKCAVPTCSDGVKNGAESDLDCGGGSCPKCASGKICMKNTDCQSNLCNLGTGTCN